MKRITEFNGEKNSDSILTTVTVYNPQTRISEDVVCLWDTGAVRTQVTQGLASRLNLPVYKQGVKVKGLGGEYSTSIYFADLGFKESNFEIPMPLLGISEAFREGAVDVIIGMDVISLGDFHIFDEASKMTFDIDVPKLMKNISLFTNAVIQ